MFHLLLFLFEICFIGLVLTTLYKLRIRFGLTPLYVTLGVFQFLQTALAVHLHFEIFPGISVSPGSAVLFTASLFSILLIYIREDVTEARKLIYGLIFANLIVSVFSVLMGFHSQSLSGGNVSPVPAELLLYTPQILFPGTLLLIIDVFLIIIVYEFVARYISRVFLRVYTAMSLVLIADTILFVMIAFYQNPNIEALLLSTVIGKMLAALIYAVILNLYLKYFDKSEIEISLKDTSVSDIFTYLTYRQKYELLKQEINKDPLTGAFNRGFLDKNVEQELVCLQTKNLSLSFMMIDIDHFKSVNDNYGHQAGDEILKQLAEVVQRSIRRSDSLCRYGGEEFAVIMPDTEKDAAVNLARRIQSNLSAQARSEAFPIPSAVTLTIGISVALEEAGSLNDLILVADKRLYRGKKSGRNCIIARG